MAWSKDPRKRQWDPRSGSARWLLADPLQVLFDVAGSPSVDADQMADHLEEWLLTRVPIRGRGATGA